MTEIIEAGFNGERLDGLLAYLDRLTALETSYYTCTREITECIEAIREELSLGGVSE